MRAGIKSDRTTALKSLVEDGTVAIKGDPPHAHMIGKQRIPDA